MEFKKDVVKYAKENSNDSVAKKQIVKEFANGFKIIINCYLLKEVDSDLVVLTEN